MSETSLRETKKEQTRVAIAKAGMALFLERGFENVSITEIAAAAHVSKMTVFNYFPSKEDIFFEFTHGRRLPDLASAVRDRENGTSTLAAIHRLARADLERHAEWTGLHDGIAKFARLIFQSTTLVNGFERLWHSVESALASAIGEARGLDVQPTDVTQLFTDSFAAKPSEKAGSTVTRTDILATLTTENVQIRLVAAQVLVVLQHLVAVNMLRQVLGQSAAQAQDAALRECDEAFQSLSDGLTSFGF
jgi:AcrR family transcriptional regulator